MHTTFRLFMAFMLLAGTTFAQQGKKITLEDLFKKGTFRTKGVPGFNAMKDGKFYTQLDRDDKHQYIRVYDLETGKQDKTLFDNAINTCDGKEINVESYQFSADEKKMLLCTEGEHIYRHSEMQRVYVFDMTTGKITKLDEDKVLHATFSPDGTKVAFVKKNNLVFKDLTTDKLTVVSRDGEKNRIINGNCDWVYEEEFSFTRAFEWSKDSRFLAWYRFDETQVPQYTMTKYNGLYPEQYTYKYPKAGELNSVVQIRIHDLKLQRSIIADIGQETDQYIPRIKWTDNANELCIYRLNRLQNELEMLLTNGETGASTVIYTDKNKCFVEIDDQITFLPGGTSMIVASDRDGYNHLYHYDWKTKAMTLLTPGSFDVEGITGVDVARKQLYYTAAETSPLQRNLYVVDFAGKKKKTLTPEPGTHNITPCAGYNFFLDKYSQLNKVPVFYLRNAKGQIIRTLEDNKDLDAKMKEYAFGNIRLMTVKGVSEDLNAWMITPPGFDSTKKYPVLMFQYSGPGSQQVADRFPVGNYFWHQMLAQRGYIVVCADGTGTGFRGEAFRKKTYLQLGKYESDDQIAAAKNLASLPYVDKDRIGIWGWSFGGFMSATCIMKGADVFKLAVSVAPVTNWRYYDNIYTERYMRTPKENEKGYDENAPEKMVDKLKGKFLLIHGTADDNVHFQNAAMLTTALINANKQFDNAYYPDKAHGISGGNTSMHLYTKMTNFILDNL
ncbi:MAG: S9 family peptidase [Flavipsychrobacter sp.]|nr:S9 family peptidase [Flavipsychrobacter sp.]